jgi:Family of unknown function (DUF5953)
MRLRTWSALLVLLTACASAPTPQPMPRPHAAPGIPHRLGWLTYWSVATARTIGFPDPARDAELLSRARRTETGGWVVRLTDALLGLDNPAHLDALKRTYERFPEIGGRVNTMS